MCIFFWACFVFCITCLEFGVCWPDAIQIYLYLYKLYLIDINCRIAGFYLFHNVRHRNRLDTRRHASHCSSLHSYSLQDILLQTQREKNNEMVRALHSLSFLITLRVLHGQLNSLTHAFKGSKHQRSKRTHELQRL